MVVAQNVGELSDRQNGWREEVLDIDGWSLKTVRKEAGEVRRIYIEGDGHAYISRDTPSGDPTPLNAVGLKLALTDSGDGVVYVGRPCQWVKGPQCVDRTLWTEKRFTQDVVDKYVALVAQLSGGKSVELVGYSGGAWVALQVAARLDNVIAVTTVAGNLMPNWVNVQHKVTQMDVAVYPVGRLADVPVTAYIGMQDKIVGRGVVDAYMREVGARDVKVVPIEATHGAGWESLKID